MPTAHDVVDAWLASHESFGVLKVLLDTLLTPCVALRFATVNPEDTLHFDNVNRCAAVGFPCDEADVADAVMAFKHHPRHGEVINFCVTQHVARRRKQISDDPTKTSMTEVEELRMYTHAAHGIIDLLTADEVDIFDTDEDRTPAVQARIRLLVFRAFSLFMLHQLFWRVEGSRPRPRLRRGTPLHYMYFLLLASQRPSASGIIHDPDAPASDCLAQDQLYRLKSTEDPFLHDLMNNYDYRTTILSDDAAPAPGQNEFSAASVYAQELMELTAAGAFAIASEDTMASTIFDSIEPTEQLEFSALDVFEHRAVLSLNFAALLLEHVKLPLRYRGDCVVAYYQLIAAVADSIGVAVARIAPRFVKYEHRTRARVNVAGITLTVEVDPRFGKVQGFGDIVQRLNTYADAMVRNGSLLQWSLPSSDGTIAIPSTESPDATHMMSTLLGCGMSWAPDVADSIPRTVRSATEDDALLCLARLFLDRVDICALPSLPNAAGDDDSAARTSVNRSADDSAVHVLSQPTDDPDVAAVLTTTLRAGSLARLTRGVPLDLTAALVGRLNDHGVLDELEEDRDSTAKHALTWEAAAVLCEWAAAVLHHASRRQAVLSRDLEWASELDELDTADEAALVRSSDIAKRALRVLDSRLSGAAAAQLRRWVSELRTDNGEEVVYHKPPGAGLTVPLPALHILTLASLAHSLLDTTTTLASQASFRLSRRTGGGASPSLLAAIADVLRRDLVYGPVHRVGFAVHGPVDRAFTGEEAFMANLVTAGNFLARTRPRGSPVSPTRPPPPPPAPTVPGTDESRAASPHDPTATVSQCSAPFGDEADTSIGAEGSPCTQPSSPKPRRSLAAWSDAASGDWAADRRHDSHRRDVLLRALATQELDEHHVALRLVEASAEAEASGRPAQLASFR